MIRLLDLSQTAARDMSADRLIRALIRLGSEVDIGVSRGGESIGEPIHLEAVAA